MEDLLKVKLNGDDLSTFIHNWESVIAGLNHQPEETTLRDILLRELRSSNKRKFDFEVYDRAEEGDEKDTYDYLVKCVKELLATWRGSVHAVIAPPLPKRMVLGMELPRMMNPLEPRLLPEVVKRRSLALHSNVVNAQEARIARSNM